MANRVKTALERSSLQLVRDPKFQRVEWLLQRVGWGLLSAVVLMGLAGLLGKGPLSDATAASPDRGVRVEYSRFLRWGDRTEVTLFVQPSVAVGSGSLELSLPAEYVDRMQVETIYPQPNETRITSHRRHYLFATGSDRRDQSKGPLQITLQLDPGRVGSHKADLRINDQPAVWISQFVYP